MTVPVQERREKALWLPLARLATVLSARPGGRLLPVLLLDLPGGAELRRVVADDLRGGVWFVFADPSFPTVVDRAIPEGVDWRCDLVVMPEGVTHPSGLWADEPGVVERFGAHAAGPARPGASGEP
jgi:hypothetical protein